MDAVQNDVLDAAVDTGHVWIELTDKNGNKQIYSHGPAKAIGKKTAGDFKSGKLPGTVKWPVDHYEADAQRTWKLSCEQCEKAKKMIEEATNNPPNYTIDSQCASNSIKFLNDIPALPAPPPGVGPVVVMRKDPIWKGDKTNPSTWQRN